MKTVRCPKCGCRIGITNGATAIHWSCPKKGLRGSPPVYVEEVQE